MKTKFLLLSILMLMVSCSTIETEDNPLIGTKWTTSYSDYLMVLEFTSNNQVTGYFAKSNGVYNSGMVNGSYTLKGNQIIFSDLTYKWIYAYYRVESATLTGSLLSTNGKQTFDIDSGEWSDWDKVWNKN